MMPDFRRLSPNMLASPQIMPEDLDEAKSIGVELVVNNRPDGEDPAAPQSDEIETSAHDRGMDYLYLPISHSGISSAQIDELARALEATEGTALAFCRSGTRSTMLWALVQVKNGMEPARVIEAAGNAGYDLSSIRPMMDMLARR